MASTFLFLLFPSFLISVLSIGFSAEDSAAILKLASALSPTPPGWSVANSTNYCHWRGIQCSNSYRVISIHLVNRNVSGTIPDVFSSLPRLHNLNLAHNNLTGTLPASFSNSRIRRLYLNNQLMGLSGTIEVLSSMTRLRHVWLHQNKFTDQIPELSACQDLVDLKLRGNLFTGIIPPSLASLPNLKDVSLSANMLQGPVPVFPVYTKVDIEGNGFCANSVGVECDPQVTILLRVSGAFRYPAKLFDTWKGNNACAWEMVGCNADNAIITLNLTNLTLSGIIYPGLTTLTALRDLVLSDNNLTGSIPENFINLPELQVLDVSNNNLSGEVPNFASSVTLITEGNPLLRIDQNSEGKHHGKVWPYVIVGVGALVIICVIILLFELFKTRQRKSEEAEDQENKKGFIIFLVKLFNRRHRKTEEARDKENVKGFIVFLFKLFKTRQRKSEEVKDQENAKDSRLDQHGILKECLQGNFSHGNHRKAAISIKRIEQWTDNFSENNVLGQGGSGKVYKGEMQDGTKIAVKRIFGATIGTNGNGSFESEIAVLSTVRHRHLVSLLGYCINGNEKILIYEYMPKGTLAEHLFQWRERGLVPLTWKQRISIALDVARGVEYLHSLVHQSLCFIHRDLKPLNILLGNEMKAKVADFGLVKRSSEGKHSLATRVAGTFGYLAPEYAATGKVTKTVDVYAFGAILMEMITGRKALDNTQSNEGWMCMHLVTWFRGLMLNNKEQILQLVDETLSLDEESLSNIVKVAELAQHCTDPKPQSRPDMCHVVKILGPIVEEWKPPIQDKDEIPDTNIFWQMILDE